MTQHTAIAEPGRLLGLSHLFVPAMNRQDHAITRLHVGLGRCDARLSWRVAPNFEPRCPWPSLGTATPTEKTAIHRLAGIIQEVFNVERRQSANSRPISQRNFCPSSEHCNAINLKIPRKG